MAFLNTRFLSFVLTGVSVVIFSSCTGRVSVPCEADCQAPPDAGLTPDAGFTADSGLGLDAGVDAGPVSGWGGGSSQGTLVGGIVLTLVVWVMAFWLR